MNYPVTRACLGFFARDSLNVELLQGTGYGHVPLLNAVGFANQIDQILSRHPWEINQVQLNLLGSHDTPRFLTLARGDESAFKLALLFLMTYPGAPCIYYGDEIGMEGGRDPDCRRSFPWPDGDDPARRPLWNVGLLEFTRQVIALRRQHPTLCYGNFRRLHATGDLYAFARCWQGEIMVVVLNSDRHSVRLELPTFDLLPDGSVLEVVWGQGVARVDGGHLHGLTIPPRSGRVLAVVRGSASGG